MFLGEKGKGNVTKKIKTKKVIEITTPHIVFKKSRPIRSISANISRGLMDTYCNDTTKFFFLKKNRGTRSASISLSTSLDSNALRMWRHADGVKATTAEVLIPEEAPFCASGHKPG